MEEMEVPLEKSEEDIHEHAHRAKEKWIGWAALASALLAALAAVTALKGGHHESEAMVERMEATDGWNFYQAKSIKSLTLASKIDLLKSGNKPVKEKDEEKLKEYGKDQEELMADAKKHEAEFKAHMDRHHVLSYGVTMFQVAIAVAAISVLSKRPPFFFVSLGFGAIGIFFLVRGII